MALSENWSEFVPGPDFSSPLAQKLTPPPPGSPGEPRGAWGSLGGPAGPGGGGVGGLGGALFKFLNSSVWNVWASGSQ